MAATVREGLEELSRRNTSQLLRLPYQAYIGRLLAELAAEGYSDITPTHTLIFQQLRAEGSRVTELAAQTQLTKQYVGRLVAELESLGYLERVPDAGDARARPVRLAARGHAVTRVAERIIRQIELDWERWLGVRRYQELRESLLDLILTSDTATS